MPISGPSSFVPCTQAFLVHWQEVNEALTSPDVLTLAGGLLGKTVPLVRADLNTLYTELLAQRGVVTAALVDLDFARSDFATLKARLVQRIGEFMAVVRGNLPDSKFVRALPVQPDVDDVATTISDAAGRVQQIWGKINDGGAVGLTLPLELQGGYVLTSLDADVTALLPAQYEVTKAAGAVKLEQEERNDIQDKIYPLLKAYRQVMPQKFAPGHALADSLPLLTPLPGATPDAVALTAVLDGPTQQARLTWTASGNADLDHYEVRAVPGGTYSIDDEVQVATIAKDAPRELLTAQFLDEPGQTASFKVYVVLTTENEAGSNAESVSRPV